MLNLLSMDLGASSGRVMRGTFDGQNIRLQELRRFANQPFILSGTWHWNFYSLFYEVKQGIAEAARIHGDIASIAVDSWAVDFGLLNSSGQLIGLPRQYRDQSHVKAMDEVLSRFGAEELFRRTGIQINPINSLFQLFAMSSTDNRPFQYTHKLLMIPDLFNYFLSGVQVTEFTNATTTQFLSPSGYWDRELLQRLDIPDHFLPEVVKPGTILGLLRDSELALLQGLDKTQVVHTTSHDTAAAVISVPHDTPDFVYISSGTWSLMGTVVEQPVINDMTQRFNLTNEGGLGNYRLLKNVMGLWLIQETQRSLQAAHRPVAVTELVQLAGQATPFQFIFNPDDTRLLQPVDMPATIRQICLETGQTSPQDTGSLVRGILESLALKYRQVLEELESVTGKRYPVIHIVGGGAQNTLLSRFTADACQRVVVTGPVEASATGNIVGQLLALGEISSPTELTALIQQSVEQETFEPRDAGVWEEAYARFRRVSAKQAETSMSI